jgi:hypothetical protein
LPVSSLATPWLAALRNVARGEVPVRKTAVRAVKFAAEAAAPGAKYSNGYILQPLTGLRH